MLISFETRETKRLNRSRSPSNSSSCESTKRKNSCSKDAPMHPPQTSQAEPCVSKVPNGLRRPEEVKRNPVKASDSREICSGFSALWTGRRGRTCRGIIRLPILRRRTQLEYLCDKCEAVVSN